MKIHKYNDEYAIKNGVGGSAEFLIAILIGIIGGITPAILTWCWDYKIYTSTNNMGNNYFTLCIFYKKIWSNQQVIYVSFD